MSDIFGVDVSSYNGSINWLMAKAAGVEFAILKVIRKDLKADAKFETNYKNAVAAGVDVTGVYNYSYATTVAKAQTDARKVLEILGDRKPMVWLDVEDSCQKGLGTLLISIINAYGEIITKSGRKFGVYTGASFYNSYIARYGGIQYPLWIATYGTNNGAAHESKRPTMENCVGWQYSSKGIVTGISGYVDVNYFYGNVVKEKNPYTEPTTTIKNGSKGERAKWVQWELRQAGYVLTIDGIFGTKSVTALKSFQKSAGLVVDGLCGAATRKALKANE